MSQQFEAEAFNIAAVDSGDFQLSPAIDGSDFTELQRIDQFAGLTRLDINVFIKPVESSNIRIALYREEPRWGVICKGETFTLKTNVTDTENGEYRALASIEVGNGVQYIALEDAEIGAQLKLVWRRSYIGR